MLSKYDPTKDRMLGGNRWKEEVKSAKTHPGLCRYKEVDEQHSTLTATEPVKYCTLILIPRLHTKFVHLKLFISYSVN